VTRLHLERAPHSHQRDETLRKTKELRAWAFARDGAFDDAIAPHSAARDEAQEAGDDRGAMKNCVYLGDDWRRRVERAFEGAVREPRGVYKRRDLRQAFREICKDRRDIVDWLKRARNAYEDAMRRIEGLQYDRVDHREGRKSKKYEVRLCQRKNVHDPT
jgi:hypothetical protein